MAELPKKPVVSLWAAGVLIVAAMFLLAWFGGVLLLANTRSRDEEAYAWALVAGCGLWVWRLLLLAVIIEILVAVKRITVD